MELIDWLRTVMPISMVKENKGRVIKRDEKDKIDKIIKEWAELLQIQSHKKLIPLFITGSGVSMPNVPDINRIIMKLKDLYKNSSGQSQSKSEIENLFSIWDQISGGKKDRSIVANILNTFQNADDEDVEAVWNELNKWLLKEILKADPTDFHKGLAKLYDKIGALCLTLNFDGLLVRALINEGDNKKAFSLPTESECEKYFLRDTTQIYEELVEIQIRGDILYLECNNKGFCSQKGKGPIPLWNALTISDLKQLKGKSNIDNLIKNAMRCPACNKPRKSYLSFPGAFEKERDMQRILNIIWKYLAFRVGSITVVGMSGEWDPLIIAFIGDMLSERNVPLLVIDKNADSEKTYIIRELVTPGIHHSIALELSADEFMNKLLNDLSDSNMIRIDREENLFNKRAFDDEYWYHVAKQDDQLNKLINSNVSKFEEDILSILEEEKLGLFAQLGLKSMWLGIESNQSKYHSRLNHSIGVMKIASFLYDKAIENSGLDPNPNEKQFLRLAALLHDLGHIPFSHLIEDVFKELKWRPAGYKGHYSHVFQTEEKVKKIFEMNEKLKSSLYQLGYNVADLIQLINGSFGVGFLDAIINSAIDADKIDYVFRDTNSVDKKITLDPIDFLQDFTTKDYFYISPEKFLVIKGRSAKSALELLKARDFLYKELYRKPGIVILEGLVKFIIKTYFVHIVELDSKLVEGLNSVSFPDLGHSRVRQL